jgi:4-hydroxy-tetrahydrodipicolinate synthase
MYTAAQEGNFKEAYAMQLLSDQYGDVYQKDKSLGESLWALKLLMQTKGLCEAIVMPPLQAMDDAAAANIKNEFATLVSKAE